MSVTYRPIQSSDWPEIERLYTQNGWTETFPHTSISSGVVVEEDAKIVGFAILQPLVRMEPIYVDPSYRGKIYLPRLVHETGKLLPKGVQCFFGVSPTSDVLAKRIGAAMITSTGSVYMKEVQ